MVRLLVNELMENGKKIMARSFSVDTSEELIPCSIGLRG
jgi:hypothetical protein